MKRWIILSTVILLAAPRLTQAALSEEFRLGRGGVQAISLYKFVDSQLWTEPALSSSTSEDLRALVQPSRTARYEISLSSLSIAQNLVSAFSSSQRPEIAAAAQALVTVIAQTRTAYETHLKLLQSSATLEANQDQILAAMLDDRNNGRGQRVQALIVAGDLLNKSLINEKGKNRLRLAEIERWELLKLIRIKFPKLGTADQPASIDTPIISLRTLLEKSKGRSGRH